MAKSEKRVKRVADLVHHELAKLIKKEVNDPRLCQVALTAVDLSADLRHANIFYTVLDEDKSKEVENALRKARGYLRSLLAHATALRYVPQLHFIYDKSIQRGSKISALIDEAVDSNPKADQNSSDEDESEG